MAKPLRKGYTTGTYASAVAKAAAIFLLEKKVPNKVSVPLGDGREAEFAPVPAQPPKGEGGLSWWGIQKDAGDDPDVTNGVWLYGAVFPLSDSQWEKLCRDGKGYRAEGPSPLYLDGGQGVGIVSKPGLSCPVGHYAINPVPRAMIFQAVESVGRQAGYGGKLGIRIAVPEGEKLAEKTFNPRLGIKGGISILGTKGAVEPMSEEALVETIRLDIRMKAAEGKPVLVMAPGNYGERFLREAMGVPLGEAVTCSNFIARSVEIAVEEGWKKLFLAGHVGKLAKVAAGAKNTHSRFGDGRMEEMGIWVRDVLEGKGQALPGFFAGAVQKARQLEAQVRGSNTTEEAVGYLKMAHLAEPVLCHGAEKVKRQIIRWAGGRLDAEVAMFSSVHQIAGKTRHVEQFLYLWRGKP